MKTSEKRAKRRVEKALFGFAGIWVDFPEEFLDFIRPDEAVLLSRLLMFSDNYKYETQEAKLQWTGWFPYNSNAIQTHLNMDEEQQAYSIKKLRDKGIISTDRYEDIFQIRINFDQLEMFLRHTER